MNEHEKSAALHPRPLRRTVLFTLIIVSVFFGALELILALIGVRPVLDTEDPFVGFAGHSPLFVEERRPDGSVLLKTPKQKLAYFNYQEFPKVKGAKAYRIFCMGGSTTVGHPYYDPLSFCGWLRAFLKAADPTRDWEVINAGGVSYASYRVARLMEELKRYQPDLFIVYSGQNEFLEQRSYGRLTALPDWALRTGAALSRTRTWAAVDTVIDAVRPKPLEAAKARAKLSGEVDEVLTHTVGPTSYHRDDRLKEQIIRHYRFGLERMVRIARGAGARILFVQPAVNLKDMSPFKSEHKDGLSGKALTEWEDLYRQGGAFQKEGQWSEALERYRRALEIDDRYAELHYRIGQLLYVLGQYDEAEKAFQRAVDEDIAPLRILSPMQRIVEAVTAAEGVPLVDFPKILKAAYLRQSNNGIPGKEIFVDHVHTSFEGYRLLALGIFDALVKEGTVKPDASWNAEKIEALRRYAVSRIDAATSAEALRILGRTLNWAGKLAEAENALLKALALEGPHPDTFNFLVTVALRQGKTDDAIGYLEKMRSAYPETAGPRLKLGELLALQGKTDEAIEELEAGLRLDPKSDLAHALLAVALVKKEDIEGGLRHFAAALKLNPDNEHAHLLLARLLTQQHREAEAVPHFRETLRINPGQEVAHHDLGLLLRKQGASEEAIGHLSEAARLKPDDPAFQSDLREARAERDRP